VQALLRTTRRRGCGCIQWPRHSDRKLTNNVYTHSRLLPLDDAILNLPGFDQPVTPINTQGFVPLGLSLSQGGKRPETVNGTRDRMNARSEHEETLAVMASHNDGDGARYRVRTCDPYRVKVVLYH
jgi:hypothetical protein